jgi:hypothetical protein
MIHLNFGNKKRRTVELTGGDYQQRGINGQVKECAIRSPVQRVFGGANLSERLSIICRSIKPVSIKQKSAVWP